jgi:hypothetical protein
MLSLANCGLSSIFYPWVVDLQGKVSSPPDRWAMYYSTDHATGNGGINVAFGPTPMGPFTKYQTGAIYANTTDGVQVETPAVLWNEDEGLLFMYYQVNGTPQRTALATSTDGIHWTRVGVVVSPYTSPSHGNHSGYFKPFRFGKSWFGYGLCKGGDTSMGALSYSKDGRFWRMDPRPFLYETQWHGRNDYKFHFGNALPFVWRGELWTFISAGDYASGPFADASRYTYAIPLASDGRSMRAKPDPVVTSLATGETRLDPFSCVIEHDGGIYAYTRRNGASTSEPGGAAGDIVVFTGAA